MNEVEQALLTRAADAEKVRKRGAPIRIEERSRPPHIEPVPGGVLVDGETLVPSGGSAARTADCTPRTATQAERSR